MLTERELRRFAEISKGELDEVLDVVRVRVLPAEREGEAAGRIDLPEHAGEEERITVGRLHLDAVAVSYAGLEFEARDGEARRPPPQRQLVSAEGAEHRRASSGNEALGLEAQLARLGCHPLILWAYHRSVLRSSNGILQLLVPVAPATLGREIEQVPDRLEGADVTGILVAVRRRIEELRAPEVADRVAVAVEHVQHRPLVPLRGLGEVVAVVGAAARGQQAQPAPAAIAREGEDALHGCL